MSSAGAGNFHLLDVKNLQLFYLDGKMNESAEKLEIFDKLALNQEKDSKHRS